MNRIFAIIFAVALVIYAAYGIFNNDLHIVGRRTFIGIHFQDGAAFSMAASLVCIAALLVVVVEKSNRKEAELTLSKARSFFASAAVIFFVLALFAHTQSSYSKYSEKISISKWHNKELFDNALTAATAEQGRDYQFLAMGRLLSNARDCDFDANTIPKFALIARVEKNGRLFDVEIQPKNDVTDCLQRRFENIELPNPPPTTNGSYPLHFDTISFANDPSDR